MNIGRAIRLCRNQKRMTQEELAKLAGISISYLSLIEKNKRDPTLSVVESIARALSIPVSILMFLSAEKEELSGLTEELREKLSRAALDLMRTPSSGSLL